MIEDAMPRGQRTGNGEQIGDSELLRRYAEEKSEAAFAELVRRHVNFVYACGLRRVGGDAQLAEDVTQQVFTALARGAAALARREVLSGWLFTTARNAAAQTVRTERRRQARETEAHLMNELASTPASDAEWERLRPVLDDALDQLNEPDREAVLLRFFEGKDFAQLGKILSVTDNTARMRVARALDKLHAALGRRGVTSTTTALALALANQAGVAAPAGLAATVTGAALAGATAAGGGLSAAITFMSITKLQVGIASAVAAAFATAYVVQDKTNAALSRDIAALQVQQQAVAALRVENKQLSGTAAEVEMLRRDDIELKQLAQVAAETKKQNQENARLAQAQSQNRGKELRDQLREKDRLAQLEVDRMNREGNALVEQFKTLSARAKDGSLTEQARAEADTAAKAKLDEIQAKKHEIQVFVEDVRRGLQQQAAEISRQYPDGAEVVLPQQPASSWKLGSPAGTLELRSSPPGGDASGYPPVPTGNARITLGLPQTDGEGLIAAYEHFTGTKVTRHPSLAKASGQIDFVSAGTTRDETVQAMRNALRDQLHIVLEPTADGSVTARYSPPR